MISRRQKFTHTILFFLTFVSVAKATEPLSIRTQAEKEIGIKREQVRSSKIKDDSALTLKLEAPQAQKEERHYSYLVQIQLQKFTPSGLGQIQSVSEFNYADLGSTVMPNLSFGLESENVLTIMNRSLKYGVETFAGYTQQKMNVSTPNSFVISDIQLSSSIIGVGPTLTYQSHEHFITGLAVLFGEVLYNQTSSNQLAQSSGNVGFFDLQLREYYTTQKNWRWVASLSSRSTLGSSDFNIERNTFGVGGEYLW